MHLLFKIYASCCYLQDKNGGNDRDLCSVTARFLVTRAFIAFPARRSRRSPPLLSSPLVSRTVFTARWSSESADPGVFHLAAGAIRRDAELSRFRLEPIANDGNSSGGKKRTDSDGKDEPESSASFPTPARSRFAAAVRASLSTSPVVFETRCHGFFPHSHSLTHASSLAPDKIRFNAHPRSWSSSLS